MNNKSPGFKKCLDMMLSRDPQIQEDGFHLLVPEAVKHVPELIEAYHGHKDIGLRCWLIELIAVAKSDDTVEFLSERLQDEDSRIRRAALHGLAQLNTKQARTLLWEAQSWELESSAATNQFRSELRAVIESDVQSEPRQ